MAQGAVSAVVNTDPGQLINNGKTTAAGLLNNGQISRPHRRNTSDEGIRVSELVALKYSYFH